MAGIRVAVVGCGSMGRHHARILSGMEGCELVAVADLQEERARDVAAARGGEALTDFRQLAERADAAVVSAATSAHREIAEFLLGAGIDILVEKPLAATVEDADAILAAASAAPDRVVAVGHTERFNPAVEAMTELVRKPRFLEIHRLGAFPGRSTDVDVILDLMIHDLDLCLHLVGRPLESVSALGVGVLTPGVDIANARLTFEDGCVANLTASRVSAEQVRKVRVFQSDAYVSVDCAGRTGEIVRLEEGESPQVSRDALEVREHDALEWELADFLGAVREQRSPRVPGEEGRRAVEAAVRVREAVEATRRRWEGS
jgi:predicted dehydrogenase